MGDRPNVLVIVTDQQRGDAFGAAGNDAIRTPAIDRLASEGVVCQKAFTESPECVPARAVMLTGRLPADTGALGNVSPLREGFPTFPRVLRDEGYATWAVGKMHFWPVRADHGFDTLDLGEELSRPEEDDYLQYLDKVGFGWVHEPAGIRHELYYLPQPSQLPDEHHVTTWTGERTLARLEEAARRGRPFLGVASFVKPHPPFDPTVPYLTAYDPEVLPDPIAQTSPPFPLEQAQSYMKWREETPAALARTLKAYYYATITQLDVQIGRILDCLEETGMADDTLVIFLSDHGELLGDHGQYGKRSFYEGGARIPFVVRWPGQVSAGVTHGGVVGQQDLAATVLTAAGGDAARFAASLPGRDVVADVGDRASREPRDVLVGSLYNGKAAIFGALHERWRWSYSVAGGRERLFDVDADPLEQVDLGSSADHADVRARMRAAVVDVLAKAETERLLDGDDLPVAPPPPADRPGWFFGRNRQYARFGGAEIPDTAKHSMATVMRAELNPR